MPPRRAVSAVVFILPGYCLPAQPFQGTLGILMLSYNLLIDRRAAIGV